MEQSDGWAKARAAEASVPPPGRRYRRGIQRGFWAKIAEGLPSEDAAVVCGVSKQAGSRWFREAGGMPPFALVSPSKRYLSFYERVEISYLNYRGLGVREIAKKLERSPSTISRELRRNAHAKDGESEYQAGAAQHKAELSARRPKEAKLADSSRLRTYVEQRLAGAITHPDGTSVPGPEAGFKGRRLGPGKDRPWGKAWSPEQIANRLEVDFPDDESMRISHEAIYQALYVQGRGALKRDLVACLRSGRALRVPRGRAQARGRGPSFVTDEVMISERPTEAEDRAVPGHWEGDLILGSKSSAIGTLVERNTRYTLLLYLPPMEGHGDGPRAPNGPALAGHGAAAVRDAIISQITTLPEQFKQTLTWDQGSEMAEHKGIRIATDMEVYFCDPASPWQRGSNENTNGLLRQFFAKGTDLSRHTLRDLEAVAFTLNGRPRKTLGWKTPAEALGEHLQSIK